MDRRRNTSVRGEAFSQETVDKVWNKGRLIPNHNPTLWRADRCGKPIRYNAYGRTSSIYGWEVDHIIPVAQNGGDELSNLQPLHWRNNRSKGDTYPWSCP